MAKKNEELTLDDLQEQHRQYAEVIGIDNLLRLSDTYGGTSIYIPQRPTSDCPILHSGIPGSLPG